MESESNEKKAGGAKFFMIISAILFAVTCFLGYQLYTTKNTVIIQTKTIEQTNDDFAEAKKELVDVQGKYSDLSTDNKQLQSQLDGERERLADISEQLEKAKGNAAEVSRLRKELKTIRNLIKSYLHQIDSLQVTNQRLTDENSKVKGDLETQKSNNNQLSKEKEDLNAKVEIGSKLKTFNLFADGLNVKGSKSSVTTKARRCDKIRCSFTLSENTIAKKGERTVYMRITGPDGNVYNNGADENSTFTYKGQKLVFSSKKAVEYNGTNKDLEMFFTKNDKFLEGKYIVEIYSEDAIIGATTVELK